MYGTRHTRDFGESVPDVWKQAILGLKRHEIEKGLRRLTANGSGSPPTLPQFMKACKEVGDDNGTLRPMATAELGEIDNRDTFDRFADHLFLNYLRRENGVAKELLPKLLVVKRQVTEDFRGIHSEDHVKAEEMRDSFFKRMAIATADHMHAL
jgi:hypothetical protein